MFGGVVGIFSSICCIFSNIQITIGTTQVLDIGPWLRYKEGHSHRRAVAIVVYLLFGTFASFSMLLYPFLCRLEGNDSINTGSANVDDLTAERIESIDLEKQLDFPRFV